jgi:hypothetical protein
MVRSVGVFAFVVLLLGISPAVGAQGMNAGGECRCMQTFIGASHTVQCEGFVYENNSRCACEPYESDGRTWCRPRSAPPPAEKRNPAGAQRRRTAPERG